jgi:5-methylcytosine-specific restriction endonuclease McrA
MKLSPQDKLWALAVKERDNYQCQRCLSMPDPKGLHAHHIFTRSRRSTRHLLRNGISLCFGCHRWAHSNPLDFHELMRSVFLGETEYEELQQLSRTLKRTGS